MLYAAVERDGVVTIPNGDFIIRPGDRVHVAADMVTITDYFRFLGKNTLRVKNVMLLGGGRISYYLAKMIVPVGMHVTLMEIQHDKAEHLSEILPDVNVIYGDGTDQNLLEQEGLQQMDAFVALTDRDEENLMAGFYATQRGVKKVIVKSGRDNYSAIMHGMGLDSIISTKAVACNTILRTVRTRANRSFASVERMYRLMDGAVEALEFVAQAGDPYIHVPLVNLNIARDCLIAVIVREGQVHIPHGNDTIETGDNVIIISRRAGIRGLGEVIKRK